MAFSYTFDSLKDAVQEWLEEDSTEFSAALPNIVNNAELMLLKDLQFSIFDQIATGTLTTASLTKPTGYLNTVDLFITVSGAQVLLTPKPWGYVNEYGGTGQPLYFAEKDATTLQVAPVPTSQAYTLRFCKRPTPLSETTGATTTWLSANVADALLWATIVMSEHFMKNDERIAVAKENYQMALTSARAEHATLVRRTYP